jgi:acyl carrier protein
MTHVQESVADTIAAQWRAVLDVRDVHGDDDFFALGGNSIRALELVMRIESELGIRFPLEVLFVEGTFDAVVEACTDRDRPR